MNFVAALLILAQLGTPPMCRYEERPAPKASRAVQGMLRQENPSRAAAERARHYAVMNRDAVGEAQGNYILARLAFERTGRWPAQYLQRAAAACAKSGCGPEMMEGLFEWAEVVGPRSPVFQQAMEMALFVAEHETIRPRAVVDQLLVDETILQSQTTTSGQLPLVVASYAARCRRVASRILRQEAEAGYGRNPARGASASAALGDLLAADRDLEGAKRAYLNAAGWWSKVGCPPESIQALMKWASALDSAKTGRSEMNDNLSRALAAAETANSRPADTDDAISEYGPVWKDASGGNQRKYLQVRRTLVRKIGSFDARRYESLARDAEQLNDWNLAFDLYAQLLKSAQDDYEKRSYLDALADVADKLGKRKEAADYRQQASRIPEGSIDLGAPAAASDAAAASGGGGGGGDDQPSPWKPPERPGKEGGTPGEIPRGPQR
jgi:tetratricopeptide (TPR) repeat protein